MVVFKNKPSNSSPHQLLLGSICVLGLVSTQADQYELHQSNSIRKVPVKAAAKITETTHWITVLPSSHFPTIHFLNG